MKRASRLAIASTLLFTLCLVSAEIHATMFRRGDVDDSGRINLADPVHILQGLFGSRSSFPCVDAADANDSGHIELTDSIYLLNFLFRRGSPPPAPFPTCGEDPTRDGLSCHVALQCRTESVDQLFGPLDGPEAFVCVIDRSASMQVSGGLEFAKSEAIRQIQSFPDNYEFAVILFDRTLLQYPEDGMMVLATTDEKSAAADWIASVPGNSGTCPEEAFTAALTALGQSAARGKRIIYFGDGGATCNGLRETSVMEMTLATVATQNTEAIVIHAVGIVPLNTIERNFLQALVDASGGILVDVELWP